MANILRLECEEGERRKLINSLALHVDLGFSIFQCRSSRCSLELRGDCPLTVLLLPDAFSRVPNSSGLVVANVLFPIQKINHDFLLDYLS